MTRVVETVVFDVGRVLIDFSYVDLFVLLRQRGAQFVDEEDLAARVDLIAYEHGHFSDAEFYRRVNALLADPMPLDQLRGAWNDLFTPCTAMLDYCRQLQQHCRVILLSNTSHAHWQHLQKQYHLNDLCYGLLASYEVGAMKPDAAIYRETEQRFGFTASGAIFVDDKLDNVEGAIACGWQGLHHLDEAATMSRLDALTGRG